MKILRRHKSGLAMAFAFAWSLLFLQPLRAQQERWVRSGHLAIRLSPDGKIDKIRFGNKAVEKQLSAFSSIDGCVQEGSTRSVARPDGSVEFSRTLVSTPSGSGAEHRCLVTEKFIPTVSSIRWELTVTGQEEPWSSRINTIIQYPASVNSRFWTTWGSPTDDPATVDAGLKEKLQPFICGGENTDFFGRPNNQWVDPLHAIPFSDSVLYYGLPWFTYEQPKIGLCPFQGNLFCIPMCSILEPAEDAGITLALSPADDIIDMALNTERNGRVQFTRLFNRISKNHVVRFSLDIVAHQADWREGLGWMADRYPRYFKPANEKAFDLAGTGAYAGPFKIPPGEKLRAMEFKTNWQASFDFPYMGMFLPPVGKDVKWKRFGDSSISIAEMAGYASRMKKSGFHVLNYFNVTEFGAKIKYPQPRLPDLPEADWWKEANMFLYKKLPDAILRVPEKMRVDPGGKTQPGGPIYTWEEGIAMDCADPAYQAFLLSQARRHIREIPEADGICIDRLDWLRFFNEHADDGRTWFDDRPARSLVHSFKQLMDSLGPLMHRAGKNIFVNNHDKRIDLLNQTDGIFDEFTYLGAPLNLTAFLSLERPALGWTDAAATIKNEGADHFFQKYLYMGVFPMCPFPANDHSIMPDPVVDGYYLEYGPLLHLLQTRRWVLKAHVVSVDNELARVNLFETPRGYVVPVVYGNAATVHVRVDESAVKKHGNGAPVYQAWYPGIKKTTILQPVKKGNDVYLQVPLVRGCAMVAVSR